MQACRGDKVQTRSQVRTSARYQADGSPPSKSYQYWIPDTADFLVARATMDGNRNDYSFFFSQEFSQRLNIIQVVSPSGMKKMELHLFKPCATS